MNEVAELDPDSGFSGEQRPRSFTCQQHSSSEVEEYVVSPKDEKSQALVLLKENYKF